MHRGVIVSILIICVIVSGCISDLYIKKDTVRVTSVPSRAEVYLDDVYHGTTPCTIENVGPGNHTLELRSPGYRDWSTGILVPSGSNLVNAELVLLPNGQPPARTSAPSPSPTTPPPAVPALTTALPPPDLPTLIPQGPDQKTGVTIRSGKDSIIIGNSVLFSGKCTACDTVVLTLFGPGKYSGGVVLSREPVLDNHQWTYKWNPGYSIAPGSYTMYVYDAQRTASNRTGVIVRAGELTITANPQSFIIGSPVTFAGTSTGSEIVILTVYGPGQYAGGLDVAHPDVLSDNTWSYTWNPGNSIQPGTYTFNVQDVQKITLKSVKIIADNQATG
ncbi:MAG: PEGA domain-containing protein [Methanoregula sp.]|nr:MAG: PEGA domain-containing protein [Methanoregula sp.]